MNPLLAYGLISGVGSLASGMMSNLWGQSNSKELMDYQAKLNQEAVDRQNAYNTPAAQMKRLAEAQLNPNLVYGSGVDGNQSSAAQVSQSNRAAPMPNFADAGVQAYMEAKNLQLAEIKTRNEAFESRSRRFLNEAKTLNTMLDNKFLDSTLKTRIKQSSQNLINSIQSYDNMVANESRTWEDARVLVQKFENLSEEWHLIKARTHLTDQQCWTEVMKRRLMGSQINVNNSTVRLNGEKIRQIGSFIEYLSKGTDLRSLAYDRDKLKYESEKAWQEWLKDHPNATITYQLVMKALQLGLGTEDLINGGIENMQMLF